jgi:hypothetical protein
MTSGEKNSNLNTVKNLKSSQKFIFTLWPGSSADLF